MAAFAKRTVLTADQKKLIIKLYDGEVRKTEIAQSFGDAPAIPTPAIPTPVIPTPAIPTPVLAAHFSQLHA